MNYFKFIATFISILASCVSLYKNRVHFKVIIKIVDTFLHSEPISSFVRISLAFGTLGAAIFGAYGFSLLTQKSYDIFFASLFPISCVVPFLILLLISFTQANSPFENSLKSKIN